MLTGLDSATLDQVKVRLLARVEESPAGCWVWQGARTSGYGCISVVGKPQRAHRVAFELFRGPIPDGLVLDHLCDVRACANPAHVRVTTHRENTLRGNGPTARNARKTHCPRGHEYDDANTMRYRGMRYCRSCRIRGGPDRGSGNRNV